MKNRTLIKIVIAFVTASLIVITSGMMSISFAWFTDRDATEPETTYMAKVDIELLQDATKINGTAYDYRFVIQNKSNIETYVRIGIILELLDKNGDYMLFDTGSFTVATPNGSVWSPYVSTYTNEGIAYKKIFLRYGNETDYMKFEDADDYPFEKEISGIISIGNTGNIPAGCVLKVTVVPEAVQADVDDDALNYLKSDKSGMNFPW